MEGHTVRCCTYSERRDHYGKATPTIMMRKIYVAKPRKTDECLVVRILLCISHNQHLKQCEPGVLPWKRKPYLAMFGDYGLKAQHVVEDERLAHDTADKKLEKQ